MTAEQPPSDVLIVGYGPVGQVLAILLAQRGWSVTVLERWPQPFPLPRAVSYDGESARILAATGVAGDLAGVTEPARDYIWQNAAGETLLQVDVDENGPCGWPDATSMYQPGLEEALARRGAALPGLRVLRGFQAVEMDDRGDRVELVARDTAGDRHRFTAAWVVGCDGANSFVRSQLDVKVTDFGFSNDWLTCDVVFHEPRDFTPNNLQICDPARPTTVVSAGPGHRRWEFMRVPGESLDELSSADAVWRLLAPFDAHPGNATVQRHAMYTFHARCAVQWRVGRVLLAGDAVHLMPPFAGQGMCSGFRDAANLAWKLDLVLRGVAGDALLDSYTAERRAHVQHAISMSVSLGKVICQPDPAAAADRDAAMLAARRRGTGDGAPRSVLQPLAKGCLHRGADGRKRPPAGEVMPQGRVSRHGETGRFDDVVGRGFALIARDDPHGSLAPEDRALLDMVGAHVVHLASGDGAPGDGGDGDGDAILDLDGVYRSFLDGAGAHAVLVRPDFYVFGAAERPDHLAALVGALRTQLAVPAPAAQLG